METTTSRFIQDTRPTVPQTDSIYSVEHTFSPAGLPAISVSTASSHVEFELRGHAWQPVVAIAGPGKRTTDIVSEAMEHITAMPAGTFQDVY